RVDQRAARLDEAVELLVRARFVGLQTEGHGAKGHARHRAAAMSQGAIVHAVNLRRERGALLCRWHPLRIQGRPPRPSAGPGSVAFLLRRAAGDDGPMTTANSPAEVLERAGLPSAEVEGWLASAPDPHPPFRAAANAASAFLTRGQALARRLPGPARCTPAERTAPEAITGIIH